MTDKTTYFKTREEAEEKMATLPPFAPSRYLSKTEVERGDGLARVNEFDLGFAIQLGYCGNYFPATTADGQEGPDAHVQISARELRRFSFLPPIGSSIRVRTDGEEIDGTVTGYSEKDGKPIVDYLGPCRLSSGQLSVPTTRWAWVDQLIDLDQSNQFMSPLIGRRVLNVHRQSCDLPQSFRDAHKGVITDVFEGCNPTVVVQFDGSQHRSHMVPNDLAFCELWPKEGSRVVVPSVSSEPKEIGEDVEHKNSLSEVSDPQVDLYHAVNRDGYDLSYEAIFGILSNWEAIRNEQHLRTLADSQTREINQSRASMRP